MFGNFNVGLVATNHTYASQDMFDPDDKISGGQGFVYASSIVVAMRKLKLKEDEDGNKVTDVRGIRAACKVMKTRYNKPFESCQVKIPWDTGMNPYSGMWEMIEDMKILEREGNRYKVKFSDGEEFIGFRKAYTDEIFMKIMKDWDFLSGKVLNIIKEAESEIVEEE
jgi:RecA/RadA recombinase